MNSARKTVDRAPRNRTEAVAALNIRRGTGQDRLVRWRHFTTRKHNPLEQWDINVRPGNNLKVVVYSGIPFLHARSGHVTVEFRSTWGNSLTIHEGASAHIVVRYADTKVTITNEGGTYTLDIPKGENHRVYVWDRAMASHG